MQRKPSIGIILLTVFIDLVGFGIVVPLVPIFSHNFNAPGWAIGCIAASFSVIAGHRQSLASLDWSVYQGVDTLVILMGVEWRDVIALALIGAGRPGSQPVAFIERASTDRERVVEATLDEVAEGKVDVESPAVLVIGEVVRLRQRLARLCPAESEA